MDTLLQRLRRLAAAGDIEARTRLSFLELNMLSGRPDANLALRLARLINGEARQDTIWWLGGHWEGYPSFISIRPPEEVDLFRAYLSMSSPDNVNDFMFLQILGISETPPENLISELSGHGSGAVYGASIYPSPERHRQYAFFERQQEAQQYWYQHPEDLLNRMRNRIQEMEEHRRRFNEELGLSEYEE